MYDIHDVFIVSIPNDIRKTEQCANSYFLAVPSLCQALR